MVDVGGAVGSVGSETAVAKVRNLGRIGRIAHIGGVYRCRSEVAFEAISRCREVRGVWSREREKSSASTAIR